MNEKGMKGKERGNFEGSFFFLLKMFSECFRHLVCMDVL